jgi:uncharacterized protein
MTPRTWAVTGSTGLIGRALVHRLRTEGDRVVRLVRRSPSGPDEVRWDPDAGTIDAAALEGVDGAVHLAGENIGRRWTEEVKRRVRESRVRGTALLAGTLAGLARPPAVLVQASAVGIYGDRGDEPLDDDAAPGSGFLAELGRAWEGASAPASAAGIRVVHLRFGVVLSAAGGALERLLLPFRLGVGGRVGSGRQWMPWLTRPDAVEIVLRALRDDRLRGPVNAAAGASRNAEFTRALAHALHRPALLPVPAFGLRALFGEMADATLLSGQRVVPARLREAGHVFLHPTLDAAIAQALRDAG